MIARDAITYGDNVLGRSPVNGGLMLLNLAGRELVKMHEWRWLVRSFTVGVTAGQNYVTLPTDFGSMIALVGSDSFLRTFIPTTLENVLHHRQFQNSVEDGAFYYAIAYRTPSGGTGAPEATLELGQDVATTNASYGEAFYTIKWNELTSEQESVSIPLELEALFLAVVEAIWFGTEEQNTPGGAHFWERIARLKETSVFRDAVKWDGRLQKTFGKIRAGAARRAGLPRAYLADFSNISDPS